MHNESTGCRSVMRSAMGGQIKCLTKAQTRPRQSCTCGQCGHPCYAMWVACMQRCVGAVCRQPCLSMPLAPQPRKIFSDLTRGLRLGTMHDAFTRCRSRINDCDYTSSQRRRRRLDFAAAVFVHPSCCTSDTDARCSGLSAVGWIRPCHDSHADGHHRTEEKL